MRFELLHAVVHMGFQTLPNTRVQGTGRLWPVLDRLVRPGLRDGVGAGWEVGLTRQGGDRSMPDAASQAEAFASAFSAHEQDVVRLCRRVLGGREEARDAPQEVYLRGRRAFDRYDPERPFRPWLLAIASNYCIDRLRHRATEERIFAGLDVAELDPPSDVSASPLARVLAREQQDTVGRAIAELPVKYRLPLLLRYFGEMDYEEIGAALGVSRNQVGTLLFRAKQQLRESVGGSPTPKRPRRRAR